jgi:UDP-N-acetylmuramate: L-alanyl-gamma-D-glutamyl-meso-diaminopimelate ligase
VRRRGGILGTVALPQFGRHNVANALGAAAMAMHYGIEWREVEQALGSFQGVRRRMEIVGEADGITVVDDFAHHPTAIRETLRAARARFVGRRLWAVLEPRSNTLRRNVFEEDLIDALSGADRVILADVFRQDKIPPAERLDPTRVRDGLRAHSVPADFSGSAEEIVALLVKELQPGDVVVAMSNGGFGAVHRKLLGALSQQTADEPRPAR